MFSMYFLLILSTLLLNRYYFVSYRGKKRTRGSKYQNIEFFNDKNERSSQLVAEMKNAAEVC